MRVKDRGQVVAEIPNTALVDEAPVYDRPTARPAYLDEVRRLDLNALKPAAPAEALLAVLRVADHRQQALGLRRQCDNMVRTNTLVLAGMGPAWSASRARRGRWRCPPTATAATAISIPAAARCWRWPKPRGTSPAPARADRRDQLPQLRQPREAGNHVAVVEAIEGIAEACRRSTCRSPAATSASTTKPTATRSITPIIGVVGVIEDASHARPRLPQRRPAHRAARQHARGPGGSEY